MTSRLVPARVAAKTERATGEGENGNTRRDGRRRDTEGGEREKDARTEPRGGEGQGTSSLIAKGGSGTVERDVKGRKGEVRTAGWTT